MSRIAVVGGINQDIVIHVPRIPQPGETVHHGRLGATPAARAPIRPWPRPEPALRSACWARWEPTPSETICSAA